MFGLVEVVILDLAEVVMVSLGPVEVVMIVNNTRYNITRVFAESLLRDDNKDDHNDKPSHFRLIT